jgi:hypothetical protein
MMKKENLLRSMVLIIGVTLFTACGGGSSAANSAVNGAVLVTHNGVDYGTVVSPHTGKVWLDRKLGAARVCTNLNDTACYGDYYQWGRDADGHEDSLSNTTNVKSPTVVNVGHSDFIIGLTNWTANFVDVNGSLKIANWSNVNGQSVCPIGFRVPTHIEIFDETIREKICKGKVSSKQWLNIHRLWHKKGKKSNATMLFGHIENRSHRIDHMLRLREVQDKTGGFNSFVPLVYQTENNFLKVNDFLSGQEILKTMAVSRLILDNIPNIKAYWVTSTVNLALLSQEFGANDLDGTIEKESINSAAGANSANGTPLLEFVELIRNSGFIPVERDSLYNELKFW